MQEQQKVTVQEVMKYIGAQYPETVDFIFSELNKEYIDFNNKQLVLDKSKEMFQELLSDW